jgi:hypothetical protein
MNKTLTSVVALAGLAAASAVAQAEDAVVAGDTMELSLSQMDEVTAGRTCIVCVNFANVSQTANANAVAYAFSQYAFYGDNEIEANANAENEVEIEQSNN